MIECTVDKRHLGNVKKDHYQHEKMLPHARLLMSPPDEMFLKQLGKS